MALVHVLTPIKTSSVKIKNRIFRSAHDAGFGPSLNERRIEYHALRARGGVGPTIIALSMHPDSPLVLSEDADQVTRDGGMVDMTPAHIADADVRKTNCGPVTRSNQWN